jgi:hypothetical protein
VMMLLCVYGDPKSIKIKNSVHEALMLVTLACVGSLVPSASGIQNYECLLERMELN